MFQIMALMLIHSAFAQDVTFENANQSLVYLNPSFAGSNGGIRMQNYYRNQWPNIEANYLFYQTCADAYLKSINGGVAITASTDNLSKGLLKTRQIGLAYAQHCVSKNGNLKITPSFQINYVQITLSNSYLNYHYPVQSAVKRNVDLSTGILINYKNFYIGGTAKHFNQPDLGLFGLSKWPVLYSFHTSYNHKLNKDNLVQVFLGYSVQKSFRQLQLSTNAVLANHFLVGLCYSNLDAMMFNTGYRTKHCSVLVGYSAVVSKLAGNTSGTWQLSCAFSFMKNSQKSLPENFETW